MNKTTSTKHPVLTKEALQQVQQFQTYYEKGTIREVLEHLKDHYGKYNQDNDDLRAATFDIVNDIRDLCTSIIHAPTLPAA